MDESLKKVRGIGAKVRGYLSAMHPEFTNRSTANELLKKYPEYTELVNAIIAHDPGIKERSLGSIRGNLQRAYEYMAQVRTGQQAIVGSKRKEPSTPSEAQTNNKRTALEASVLPNSISAAGPMQDSSTTNVLDSLVSDKMKEAAMGEKNYPLKDGSMNVGEPLPTWAQQQKNYPLADAISETKAIDLAERDPIKPHKELEYIPDALESALLTVQEESNLETRNAGRLLHTTILPAAALVPNDGGGAREGVRRSDNDMKVEEEEQKEEKKLGAGGGSSGAGKGKGPTPFTVPAQPNRELTMSEKWAQGLLHGPLDMAIGGLGEAAKLAMLAYGPGGGVGAIANNYGDTPYQSATSGITGGAALAANKIANTIIDKTTGIAKKIADKSLDTVNIRARMAREGYKPEDIGKFQQKEQEITGRTEFESKGRTIVVNELRPFLPIAGSEDVELAPGDVENKKRNILLFSDYKPPNWPLGNMDNQLYFQNLVLQGIQ